MKADTFGQEYSDDQLEAQIRLVEEKLAGRKLDLYKPHPKQLLFHSLGGDPAITDRLLMAGNQLGKTMAAAAETAMHLCGYYPSWWKGKRFDHAVKGWVGCETSQAARDAAQRLRGLR